MTDETKIIPFVVDKAESKTREWSRSTLSRKTQTTEPGGATPSRAPELPKYETKGSVGEGGMGTVYEATDLDMRRGIALKVLHPDLVHKGGAVLRFIREARSTGRLEHPNIPPVHEIGEDETGVPFFTMKLIRGENLANVIQSLSNGIRDTHRRFTYQRRAQLVADLCDAVHFAHESGVFHRDIKPENIMVGPFGEVQLMDWGASYDSRLEGDTPEEPHFMGTLLYASPERFDDPANSLRPSSDVYSLGAVMYELFTLHEPYRENSVEELVEAVRCKEPRAPELIRHPVQGKVPVEFANIIKRAMAKDPNSRYATAAEFRAALQDAMEGQAPVVCPCTGMKKFLTVIDGAVNNYAPLVFLTLLLWTLAPILMGAYIFLGH